jgi:transposase
VCEFFGDLPKFDGKRRNCVIRSRHDSIIWNRLMSEKMLFEAMPEQAGPERPLGMPRLLEPVRNQLELRSMDIDSLIGEDHAARLIWAYVEQLDLRELEDAIKAREGRPGHPAITPRLLLALWLYATSDGVGSARALARLCESHDAYRWLVGGVSVNHHTLADFRVDHGELLDRLLTENVATLAACGLIDLNKLTQDGVRVRASAGAASYRRRERLEEHLARAHEVVEQLKREVHDDPAASSQRIRAARERAARERKERVAAAIKTLGEVEAQRERRKKTNRKQTEKQKEPRASTTDPGVRVMKMADGGFRPAYNVQVVSIAGQQIVVGVKPSTVGSDRGLMRSMLEKIRECFERLPECHFADGGYAAAADIEWAHSEGVAVYSPPTQSKHGTDPFQPRDDDGPGVLAWRNRMASDEGKAQYRQRAIGECIHARWRNWNLIRLNVRGEAKVMAAILWHALANNILQADRMLRGHRITTA